MVFQTLLLLQVDVIAMTDNFISRKTGEAPNLFNRILSLINPCFKSIYGIIFFLIEENLFNMWVFLYLSYGKCETAIHKNLI